MMSKKAATFTAKQGADWRGRASVVVQRMWRTLDGTSSRTDYRRRYPACASVQFCRKRAALVARDPPRDTVSDAWLRAQIRERRDG